MTEFLSAWLIPIIAGLFGAATGSLVNVIAYRVPLNRSLWEASACPLCAAPIRFLDITPVAAWFWLRGQCRTCGGPIAFRYPAIEALVGTVWLLIVRVLGLTWGLAGALWTSAGVIAMALMFMDGAKPPSRFVLRFVGVGLALLLVGRTLM